MSVGACRAGECTCGCCEPPAPATPELVDNRPHLSEVGYRVGRYATFRQAMVQLVPELGRRLARDEGLSEWPLARWTSRDGDDYGMAAIEMWATVADILSFYQERYANEAWLRTARGRDAIRRLAGLIGYEPSPGLAAETYLAYTLDAVDLELRAGLRVQSVPKEGELPQVYETMSAVAGRVTLNRVPVHGAPQSIAQPLGAGRTSATLAAGSPVPVEGDAVTAFTPNGNIEHRSVDAVTQRDGRSVVHWSRALDHAHTRVFLKGRSWRLFGHQAPPTYTTTATAGTSGSFLEWMTHPTGFTDNGASVTLESVVDRLETGRRVLVDDDGIARLRTIEGIRINTATRGPLTGSATVLDLSASVAVHAQRALVYELGDELDVLHWELPTGAIATTTTLYVSANDVDAIEAGRRLVVDDDAGDPFLVKVAADTTAVAGVPELLAVELVAETTRSLDADSAYLLGNVAMATHGETVAGEVLGNGDAAATFQAFTLAKSRVTHVRDVRAPGGARSTVEVDVDRVRWRRVDNLFAADPVDRVYTESIGDDDEMTIAFGDGAQGSRLPTGRANVVASYRKGIGRDGLADADQITTALDKPTGLRGVTNPLPATGGVDPEDVEDARRNAPNTVRTFDRAVALRDFGFLARDMALVDKAIATWVWDGEERVVFVTVGSADGSPLDSGLADVQAYVDARRDPNRSVRIADYRPVPFLVQLDVTCAPDQYRDDVEVAVRAALEGYFAYEAREFAQAVHVSDLYAVVHDVAGVESARVTQLRYRNLVDIVRHGVGAGPVLVHAPVFGARRWPSGVTVPAELAVLDDPDDLKVDVAGGLVDKEAAS